MNLYQIYPDEYKRMLLGANTILAITSLQCNLNMDAHIQLEM